MKPWIRNLLPILWTLLLAPFVLYAVWYLIEGVYEVDLFDAKGFQFERAWAVLLLLSVPLLFAAQAYVFKNTAPRLLVSRGKTLSTLKPGWRLWIRDAPLALRVIAVLLMCLGLMGPQSIHARDASSLEGIDMVVTLDLSGSMQAEDIRPNRFLATKQVVDQFIRHRPNDRIGAVVFGRDAYTLLPLTTDKETLRSTISELQLGSINGRGTAIGNALATSLNRLRNSEAESQVVILLTDGDSNAGSVSPDQATEFARTMGVKVFTILMGQQDQARVSAGGGILGQLQQMMEAPVNPDLLTRMAEQTGGTFFRVSDRQGLESSFHAILNELERSEIEDLGTYYSELFPAFIWPALFLLIFELLLGSLVLRRWP